MLRTRTALIMLPALGTDPSASRPTPPMAVPHSSPSCATTAQSRTSPSWSGPSRPRANSHGPRSPMTGSRIATLVRPARGCVTEVSTSGPRLTSTSPVSLTAGHVCFVHNARPAGSGALLTRPTRTCGTWARAEMQTELYKRSMRLRRGVERVFADAKTKRGLTRLHLRGIRGAEEEFQVAAAVSNLLLLARPAARASRPGRARAVLRRVSDTERVSRNRSAVPAMLECR